MFMGRGDGRGEGTANLHAGVPGDGHGQIAAKASRGMQSMASRTVWVCRKTNNMKACEQQSEKGDAAAGDAVRGQPSEERAEAAKQQRQNRESGRMGGCLAPCPHAGTWAAR